MKKLFKVLKIRSRQCNWETDGEIACRVLTPCLHVSVQNYGINFRKSLPVHWIQANPGRLQDICKGAVVSAAVCGCCHSYFCCFSVAVTTLVVRVACAVRTRNR